MPETEVTGIDTHVPIRDMRQDAYLGHITRPLKEKVSKVWTRLNHEGYVYTHNVTHNNEEQAIRNRALLETPKSTNKILSQVPVGEVNKTNLWETARRLDRNKKGNRYQAAAASLEKEPVQDRDSRVKMFIKVEKHCTEEQKETRCIQHRDERYTLRLAQYLLPIEDAFIHTHQTENYIGQRLYTTKGLSTKGKASLVRSLWHEGLHIFSVDISRMDAHVSVERLREKHQWYLRHYNGDRFLKYLLKQQEKTKGITHFGRKYRRDGGVCSGDIDTSLGNSWVIGEIWLGIHPEVIVIVEGDDALLIGEPKVIQTIAEIQEEYLLSYGFKGKGYIATEPTEAEYCSARIGKNDLIRNWPKPLNTDGWSTHDYHEKHRNYISRSMAISALYQYADQPVYDKFALLLWHRAKAGKISKKCHILEKARPVDFRGKIEDRISACMRDKSIEERVEFAIATGVSPHEQRQLERALYRQPRTPTDHDREILTVLRNKVFVA
jgi:hypothetical protein